MKTHNLPTTTLPLNDSFDVIVAGGGPSGCTAAVAAAREGAKTLLIEATGCLGGMGTSGLIPAWCPFSDGEKIVYRGLAERVFNAAKADMPHVKADTLDWVAIDHERLKCVYDELVLGAGADILFGSMVAAVETDGAGSVSAITVANKSGLTVYKARVYIDCTGDADLAAWAGAQVMKGDAEGTLQPATHCFVLGNVDDFAFRNGPNVHTGNPTSPVHSIHTSDAYPAIIDAFCCAPVKGPGTVGFNASHVWDVDGTDPSSVSRALVQGRKIARQFRDGLAEFHPSAFANSFLVATGALLGVRETRRIVGDYVLTRDDYMARATFPDEICRSSYCIDVHYSLKEMKLHAEGKLDDAERSAHYGKGESYGVPYRCLTPKGLRNVLVAGRPISADRAVHGSVRVMPPCLCTGEAAGVAARMAAEKSDVNVHDVDTHALRDRLRTAGAYLP